MPSSGRTSRSDTETIRDQIEVLSIAEGFFESSVLFALLELKIFEWIGDGEKPLPEIAAAAGARPDTLARLLNAGVACKLLESEDGLSYRLSRACRSVLLPAAGDNDLSDWIRHLEYLRDALSRLDRAVLESGPAVDPGETFVSNRERTRRSILAMHSYASLRGKELVRFLDTRGCESLLDVGCGPGTYAFHLGLENPDLELHLLDLPEVLEVTREIERKVPLRNAVHYLPIDVLQEEVPGSYDLVLVSNALHMLGKAASRRLVERLYGSVHAGGSLVIQGQFLRDDHLGDRWPALLDLSLLCVTAEGRNHSAAEAREWLREAGFRDVEHCSMTVFNANSFVRGFKR